MPACMPSCGPTWVPCRSLPVPVVIDHMAMFNAGAGIDQPGYDTLRALLAEGRVWAKLCAYRNLLSMPDRADWQLGQAFQQALITANPDQLVWGSDWPHLNVRQPIDAAVLLDDFRRWAGDANIVDRVLRTNPARLYG